MTDLVFTEILAKLDRAAINGQRLHLDVEHVRALATSKAYATLAELKSEEFAQLWREEENLPVASPPASSSGTSGLSPESSEANGSLHGTMQGLVHDAEERQASATAEKLSRHSRRRKRLRPTSPNLPGR